MGTRTKKRLKKKGEHYFWNSGFEPSDYKSADVV